MSKKPSDTASGVNSTDVIDQLAPEMREALLKACQSASKGKNPWVASVLNTLLLIVTVTGTSVLVPKYVVPQENPAEVHQTVGQESLATSGDIAVQQSLERLIAEVDALKASHKELSSAIQDLSLSRVRYETLLMEHLRVDQRPYAAEPTSSGTGGR